MKDELDLRTREFIRSTRFFRRRPARFLLLLLSAAAVFAMIAGARQHLEHLQQAVASLKQANRELAERLTAPELRELPLNTILARMELEAELSGSRPLWSACLETILETAPAGLNLDRIAINSQNELTLSGTGETMQQIALFGRSLDSHRCFHDTAVPVMSLEPELGYRFTITAVISHTGGRDLEN
jgi:Tfp pilus assembly protein PilN